VTPVQDQTQEHVMAAANAGADADRRDSGVMPEDSATCGKFPAPLVLIIEGDDLLRWALAEAAGDAGYGTVAVPDVATARHAQNGLAQATVVLVDSNATRADRLGLAVLKGSLPTSTFAMMTDDSVRSQADAVGLGAGAVFVKPFDLTAVQAYLRSIVVNGERA
jgi:DNA-binding NtrC family response regulator